MADVKWIKIAVDMFDNRKIKQIGSMPEGDSLLLMWVHTFPTGGHRCGHGRYPVGAVSHPASGW